jgi:hypothetical protein
VFGPRLTGVPLRGRADQGRQRFCSHLRSSSPTRTLGRRRQSPGKARRRSSKTNQLLFAHVVSFSLARPSRPGKRWRSATRPRRALVICRKPITWPCLLTATAPDPERYAVQISATSLRPWPRRSRKAPEGVHCSPTAGHSGGGIRSQICDRRNPRRYWAKHTIGRRASDRRRLGFGCPVPYPCFQAPRAVALRPPRSLAAPRLAGRGSTGDSASTQIIVTGLDVPKLSGL